MQAIRLGLIEDDPAIGKLLSDRLKKEGYEVSLSESAEKALKEVESAGLKDLYIVDILLKGKMTGLGLCEELRQKEASVPILILSALNEPVDRIEGLRSGADDYLTKPFEYDELLLRVKGMLRRRSWYRTSADHYTWEGGQIDFSKMTATHEGKTHSLGVKECMILKLLIENEGKVVSRDLILNRVWGEHAYPSSRTIDNFIVRLRKIFNPKYIQSIRGMGYKFVRSEGTA